MIKTCPGVSRSLQLSHGSVVACCRVGGSVLHVHGEREGGEAVKLVMMFDVKQV